MDQLLQLPLLPSRVRQSQLPVPFTHTLLQTRRRLQPWLRFKVPRQNLVLVEEATLVMEYALIRTSVAVSGVIVEARWRIVVVHQRLLHQLHLLRMHLLRILHQRVLLLSLLPIRHRLAAMSFQRPVVVVRRSLTLEQIAATSVLDKPTVLVENGAGWFIITTVEPRRFKSATT